METQLREAFGAEVRALRVAKNIGFSEMVKRTGLDGGNYSKMERGLMPAPKLILSLEKRRILAPKDLRGSPDWAKPIVAAALRLSPR